MDMDPELQKQLLETFKQELDEQAQIIVESLLLLEKNNVSEEDNKQLIQTLFRAAHTIKGAARSVAIMDVGEIAHGMESLFKQIQNNEISFTPEIITSCLKSVDAMREAMNPKDKIPPPSEIIPPSKVESPKAAESPSPAVNHINKPSSESIRVDVDILDKISTLMDDVILNKISLEEYITKFQKIDMLNKKFFLVWNKLNHYIENELAESVTDELHKINHEGNDLLIEESFQFSDFKKNIRYKINEMTLLSRILQDEINKLRLVPASVMFNVMPRQVRDLANELNKNIDLEIVGGNVKMDKMILDIIKDPIIHILRNAIDHGIESPDVRAKQGKSAEGKLKIEIIDQGSQIVINISDNGKGIDLEAIKRKAVEKNIYSQVDLDNLSLQETLNIIFHSGFSTRDTVSSVSGRGVGLDVVLANLEKVKGRVEVVTNPGVGTTFKLFLPLTLTSEHGLIVKAQGEMYAIPSAAIERIYATANENVAPVANGHVVMLDKHPVPVFLLSQIVGGSSDYAISGDLLIMVIVKKATQRIAILVDEVINEREMVVKPLQDPLSHLPCVSGGTLSDEGQVIYVLNAGDLIDRSLSNAKTNQINFNEQKQPEAQIPHILVVDDSITTRTLERNILESRNYLVTTAVNGKEAWDLLQKINFSIVITDVNMPVMDGFELTDKIKQTTKHKDLPVVIVTSLDSEEEKKRGIEVGANAYVIKSQFESGALLEIVSQLVK